MTGPDTAIGFSVIATVRNEREGIRDFVESLLSQSLKPTEVIIVDGVSTDGTLEILEDYHGRGLIRLISQPCNISEGRNLGIAAARCEFIAATDAGCTADPHWLENLAAGFAQDPAPDVVAGNYEFETHSDFELASCFATDAPDRETSEAAKYYPSSRSIAFRKSVWEAVKGYPEWLYAAEDTLYNIQLRRKGFRFHFARDAKVSWRPRTTWKGLFRQYFNYARGNGRIGLGLGGYVTNLRIHGFILCLTLLSFIWPLLLLLAGTAAYRFASANLWRQARHAQAQTGRCAMLWWTLLVMEVVRIAGMAGYVAGRLDRRRNPLFVESQKAWMGTDSIEPPPAFPHWTSIALGVAFPAQVLLTLVLWQEAAGGPALCVAALLTIKSILNFSRTGPELKDEIQTHYARYSVLALARLTAWSFTLCLLMTGYGQTLLMALDPQDSASAVHAWAASFLSILVLTGYQFCRHLLFIPASLAASSSYRLSRFYDLWSILSPGRLAAGGWLIAGSFMAAALTIAWRDLAQGSPGAGSLILLYLGNTGLLLAAAGWPREPKPARQAPGGQADERMNLLMIGCDTLRADRLGIEHYGRPLTPNLDALAARSLYLSKCYVPCARTAPSLASMLTGLFPQKHGIRDNFALPSDAHFPARPLPHILSDAGYQTIAISDWAGGDLGKFDFGFKVRHLPADQWNIKYLIRQGPKDIRFFLSLFTHNRFGKRYLPELHYLAGIPMTDELGRTTREAIGNGAASGQPFFINTFFSTAHAPFGTEYPFYTLFSGRDYRGDSKFVMSNLDDPYEIIKRQRDSADDVDLQQILALYDASVKRFDTEVGRILGYLKESGLADKTLVVIYSDHGIDFFEHGNWGQGNSIVSDESARVPVIIADPRQPAPRTIDTTTRTVDLPPTILDLLGMPAPAGLDGRALTGQGIGEPLEDLPVYGETGIWFCRIPSMPEGHLHYPELSELLEVSDKQAGSLAIKPQYKSAVLTAKDRMIRLGRWKLVRIPMQEGPRYSLYDVGKDGAGREVSELHPQVFAEMRNTYQDFITEDSQLST